MSVPQSNSTQMTPTPTAVAERTRRTPDAPLMALSIGNVTSDSISSGAIPCPSARMVTVGAVRSGKTSIGIARAVQIPAPRSSAESPMTIQWWSIDHVMSCFMSVHVSFGGEAAGGRRELHVVGAARHHALAWLHAGLDADQIAVTRCHFDE